MVKNLPAVWKTRVPSLNGEDPLEKEMEGIFLPVEFHGQRSLAEWLYQGVKESDITLHFTLWIKNVGPELHI